MKRQIEVHTSEEGARQLRKALEDLDGELFLERPKTIEKRKIGNTTRLVDYYIQVLFRDGTTKIEDHYNGDKSNRILAGKIADRILNEHNIEVEVYLKKGINISIK